MCFHPYKLVITQQLKATDYAAQPRLRTVNEGRINEWRGTAQVFDDFPRGTFLSIRAG